MYFNKFSFKLLSCLISAVHKRSYTSLQNFNLNILPPQPRIIFHGCFFDCELFFFLSNSLFSKFARNLFIINWNSFEMKFSHKSKSSGIVLHIKFRYKIKRYTVKKLLKIAMHIIFNRQIIWIKNLKKKEHILSSIWMVNCSSNPSSNLGSILIIYHLQNDIIFEKFQAF